ncbi:MAG: hypothetical protein AAFP76_04400 [Bacteroidota bacterium]
MKLKIRENSVTLSDLKQVLTEEYGHTYTISERNKSTLVVKENKTTATLVMVTKNKILVVGNFPTMGMQIAFTLSVILLGFLIPLIIYFAVFHKKMKRLEKEVGEFLAMRYSDQFAINQV